MATAIRPVTNNLNVSSLKELAGPVNDSLVTELDSKADVLISQVESLSSQIQPVTAALNGVQGNINATAEIREEYEYLRWKINSVKEAIANYGYVIFHIVRPISVNNIVLPVGIHRFTSWPGVNIVGATNQYYPNLGIEKIIISGIKRAGGFNCFFSGTGNGGQSPADAMKEYNVSGFDSSNITSLALTFSGLANVKYLDVEHFDTSKVKNIDLCFYGDWNLRKLNVKNWDVSNVTTAYAVFWNCSKLKKLDLSTWTMPKCTNFKILFQFCTSLQELDISSLDTSSATNMDAIFFGCNSITSLKIGPNFFNAFSRTESPLNYIGLYSLSKWTNVQELTDFVNNLPTVDHTCTLQFHANTKRVLNENGLTQIATDKGWTIA